MAGELDPGPRDVPSQEPDAQPPALAPGRRRHRRVADLGPRRVAGQGRGPRRSSARRSRTALDELVKLYVTKGGYKTQDGKTVVGAAQRGRRVRRQGARAPTRSSMFLGEKTIRRLGCFGCHTIPGFENAKPIGTPLNDWGIKSPARLDYGHIAEYLEDQPQTDERRPRRHRPVLPGAARARDPDRASSTRSCTGPRSYDYLKTSETYKTWDDRLRMPSSPGPTTRRPSRRS